MRKQFSTQTYLMPDPRTTKKERNIWSHYNTIRAILLLLFCFASSIIEWVSERKRGWRRKKAECLLCLFFLKCTSNRSHCQQAAHHNLWFERQIIIIICGYGDDERNSMERKISFKINICFKYLKIILFPYSF